MDRNRLEYPYHFSVKSPWNHHEISAFLMVKSPARQRQKPEAAWLDSAGIMRHGRLIVLTGWRGVFAARAWWMIWWWIYIYMNYCKLVDLYLWWLYDDQLSVRINWWIISWWIISCYVADLTFCTGISTSAVVGQAFFWVGGMWACRAWWSWRCLGVKTCCVVIRGDRCVKSGGPIARRCCPKMTP